MDKQTDIDRYIHNINVACQRLGTSGTWVVDSCETPLLQFFVDNAESLTLAEAFDIATLPVGVEYKLTLGGGAAAVTEIWRSR